VSALTTAAIPVVSNAGTSVEAVPCVTEVAGMAADAVLAISASATAAVTAGSASRRKLKTIDIPRNTSVS